MVINGGRKVLRQDKLHNVLVISKSVLSMVIALIRHLHTHIFSSCTPVNTASTVIILLGFYSMALVAK